MASEKAIIENDVEKHLRERVKRVGGKAYKLSSQIENGMPDRLVCLPGGRVFFIETKRPKGGRLSKIQIYRHRELTRIGVQVRVLCTKEAIDEFITNFTKEAKPDAIQTPRLPAIHDRPDDPGA